MLSGPLFTSCLQVFKLYGVEVLAVNGGMSFDKRTETLKKFRTESRYRVLALSSVGTTGINLAYCSMIIFLVRYLIKVRQPLTDYP